MTRTRAASARRKSPSPGHDPSEEGGLPSHEDAAASVWPTSRVRGGTGEPSARHDGPMSDGAAAETPTWFASVAEAGERLAAAGYLADVATATTTYLAGALEKPLLVEGPAGVGKTELAKAIARATGAGLVRLQCYEGLDEARALYEWNYKKQLLRIQAS